MENKRYTPEEVLNLQSQAYQKGCNEGYELCKKQHPGIGWVKCSDRLPGYKKRVKWRDGNDHSYATDGEISLFEMDKPNLEGWEWLDESGAAAAPTSQYDNALYETRLALRDLIKLAKLPGRSIAEYRQRIEAAEGILNKHTKVTDVLRTASPAVSQDAHEKEIMMQAFDKVRQIFEGRQWVMDGRGCYPYNDDRYKEEVRYMHNEFDEVVKDTWANIKSKSVDYRKAIIAEYLASPAAGREDDTKEFAEWAGWDWRRVEGKSMWENQKTLEVFSTSKLYEKYKEETRR